MSYQVIARKWRPRSFDEVVGQEHVTTPLRNAIRSDRVPHAILLTGPRGVGKTTLARILARCLNCEKGPTDTPCGSCDSCREISAGNSTDVQEIDAASRTSVDDVRELIEAVRYAPSPGKYRIFVVDEVHMLSAAAFNALLKTLEEPPPRSLFVFATTNPEKIPFTVLSRCQRHDLRRIPAADVVEKLRAIAESEGISVSDQSLRAMAREGEGSMRDSQTLLDQVIATGGKEVADETVSQLLDLIDRRVLIAIASACVQSDPAAALEACASASGRGTDPVRLGAALLQTLRDLVVLNVAGESEGLVEGSAEEIEELRELSRTGDPTRLRRMFRALLKEQEDLAWAPEPEAVLEMALVRLATMPSGENVDQLLARLDALERRLSGGGGSGPAGGGGSAGRISGAAKRSENPRPRGKGRESAARDVTPETPSRQVAIVPSRDATPRTSAKAAEIPDADAPLEAVFDRLRGFAQQRNRGLFASLDEGRLLERRPGHLHISLPAPFHVRRMSDKIEELNGICSEFFGEPTRVGVVLDESGEGAAESNSSDRDDVQRRRQDALSHPAINIALEELRAEIVEIRPLGGKS